MRRPTNLLTLIAAVTVFGAGFLVSAQAIEPITRARGGWNAEEVAVLASLRLSELPALPDDPSNAVQRSAAAASLGRQLFFDKRFSGNQSVACASCHDPDHQFQDGRPVGEGVGMGSRRTMPIVAAGYSPWLFWDGRKDSLWSQALGPLEDPREHGGNRLRYARLMQTYYRQSYTDLFGLLPDLADLPDDASPNGTAAEQVAWQRMTPDLRDAVSRVFANMGKAIAAYERTLQHTPSRLDRYIEDILHGERHDIGILTRQEVRGLRLFIGSGQCVGCHNGPLFTDQQFHNTGVPPRNTSKPDGGRSLAVNTLRADEFNCLGRYSDAGPAQCQELGFLAEDRRMEGAFRTAGLRNVASRPPYMHAGQLASLEDVIRHYVEAPPALAGRSELSAIHRGSVHSRAVVESRSPIRLSASEQQDLVAFLRIL